MKKKSFIFFCLLLPFIALAGNGGRVAGSITGHVFDQDGATPIADALVWIKGLGTLGDSVEYQMITDSSGCFFGTWEAGSYHGGAMAWGYADTVLPYLLLIPAGDTLRDVSIVMHENYAPLNYVVAEELNEDMVKVSWGKGEPQLLEDFECGNFTKFDWDNGISDFPWTITSTTPHQGQYCMKSTNEGQGSTTSAVQVAVTVPKDGKMSFFGKASCEQTWDFGSFYIDDVKMCELSGNYGWQERVFDISQGEHVFRWQFEKDVSTDAGDDCFYVDDIRFYYKQPPFSGEEWISYSNDIYYTNVTCSVDHSHWGCCWLSEDLTRYEGALLTKVSIFSDSTGHAGGNYTVGIYTGGDTYPLTLLTEQEVMVPDSLDGYAVFDLNDTVEIDDTQNLWMVWSSEGNTYQAATCTEPDPEQNGTWWGNNTTWSHSGHGSWMTKAYLVDTAGQQRELALGDGSRNLRHFNVWRRRTESDSLMIASHILDSAYMDMSWKHLPWGTYYWGVGCTYEGNRGESPIVWSSGVKKDMTTTAEFFVRTDTEAPPTGAEIVLTRADGIVDEYRAVVDATGHYVFDNVLRAYYDITVSLNGYLPYHSDTAVSILEPAVFHCELKERVQAPETLYVSHTGWTTWTMPADKERSVVGYEIMLDGVSVGTTVNKKFQFDVSGLSDSVQYVASVRAQFVTGVSEWIHHTWIYRSCDHFQGTQNGVSVTLANNKVEVSWTYPDINMVGALVFRDGNLLGYSDTSIFIDANPPFANQQADYCVRIIHNGPHDGTYYSMSCAECVHLDMPMLCDPPELLRGNVQWLNEMEHGALISWGPKPSPINEWLHYDDNAYLGCLGSQGTLYWGIRFDKEDLADFAGCALTQVAIYDVRAIEYTVSIYQGGETAPETPLHFQSFSLSETYSWHEEMLSNVISIDTTKPLWIVFSQIGYRDPAPACANTGNPDGRWVSMDGIGWSDLGSNTWMIRCFVTNMLNGNRSVLDVQEPAYNMQHFNLYRSNDNVNYQQIATIDTVHGQEYYTYFDNYVDEPELELYYRLTAYYVDAYGNECESFPAASELHPDQHYVHVTNPWSLDEKEEELRIYPVPARDELHILVRNMRNATLYNAMGQVVVDQPVAGDEAVLSLSHLPNGIFMLQITGENYRYSRRIIISH